MGTTAGGPVLRLELEARSSADLGPVPPTLAVDVYDNSGGVDLDAWLESRRTARSRSVLSPAKVADREGIRETDPAQMAPNVYYWLVVGRHVYRFTPLGPAADEILATLDFQ